MSRRMSGSPCGVRPLHQYEKATRTAESGIEKTELESVRVTDELHRTGVRLPPPPPNKMLVFNYLQAYLSRCTEIVRFRIGSTFHARLTSASICSCRSRTHGA